MTKAVDEDIKTKQSKTRKIRTPVYLFKKDFERFSAIAEFQQQSAAELLRYRIEKFTDADLKKVDIELMKKLGPKKIAKNLEPVIDERTIHFINFFLTPDNRDKIDTIIEKLKATHPKKKLVIKIGNVIQYIINQVIEENKELIITKKEIPTEDETPTKDRIPTEDEKGTIRFFITLKGSLFDRIIDYVKAKRTTLSELLKFNYEYFTNDEFEKYRKLVKEDIPLSEEELKEYSNPDADPNGSWKAVSLVGNFTKKTTNSFVVTNKKTKKPCKKPDGGWRYAKETIDSYIKANRIIWPDNDKGVPELKQYLFEASRYTRTAVSLPKTINGKIKSRCEQINEEHLHRFEAELQDMVSKEAKKNPTADIKELHSKFKKQLKAKYRPLNIQKSAFIRAFILFIFDRIDKLEKHPPLKPLKPTPKK